MKSTLEAAQIDEYSPPLNRLPLLSGCSLRPGHRGRRSTLLMSTSTPLAAEEHFAFFFSFSSSSFLFKGGTNPLSFIHFLSPETFPS